MSAKRYLISVIFLCWSDIAYLVGISRDHRFDIKTDYGISMRKIKLHMLSAFIRHFSVSNTLHFRAGIFYCTKICVIMSIEASVFSWTFRAVVTLQINSRFMNIPVWWVIGVCYGVSIFRFMLTICGLLVFAYTLFAVERFRKAVSPDRSVYKYFMLTNRFRSVSSGLSY